MSDFVYFIGNDEAVKIGRSNKPTKRRLGIQNGNPKRVEILGTVVCDNAAETEAWLHRVFSADRLEGEWFSHSPLLDYLIEFLNSYMPVPMDKHIEVAFRMYHGAPYQKNETYFHETMLQGDAFFMLMTDLNASGGKVGASEMREALGYYKAWLVSVGTFNFKRFRVKSYSKTSRREIESWSCVKANGQVRNCPNFFYTEEFKQLSKPQPFPQMVGEVQLDLFKSAG